MAQTIEVVVRLTVSEDDSDVHRLEGRVEQAHDEAGRGLLVRALEVLDEMALENPLGVVRQRRGEPHQDTRLGHVVYARWRVKKDGKTTYLRDRPLGASNAGECAESGGAPTPC